MHYLIYNIKQPIKISIIKKNFRKSVQLDIGTNRTTILFISKHFEFLNHVDNSKNIKKKKHYTNQHI